MNTGFSDTYYRYRQRIRAEMIMQNYCNLDILKILWHSLATTIDQERPYVLHELRHRDCGQREVL